MKLADFTRLKKLMTLTFSDNDHEALAALRAANAILARETLDWFRVLDRVIQIVPEVETAAPRTEPPASNRRTNAREIEEAFADLYGADLGDFEEFITSLRRQWRERGSLSDKQRAILLKAANRERSR